MRCIDSGETRVPKVIPLTQLASSWNDQLKTGISNVDTLLENLNLTREDVAYAPAADTAFPTKVPLSFVQRMCKGDPNDPLLLQVLATADEALAVPGYTKDPVGETGKANSAPGFIHKYHGRVLLIVSGGCAINCRYCFRRHFPYNENQNSREQWRRALDEIANDTSISEVILSGGDPLVVTDAQLKELVDQIASIPHIKRLRIHSRLPVVIPARITSGLLNSICTENLQTIMVIHSNHTNEIDEEVSDAINMLKHAGVEVFNQAVLLAGVNDNLQAQINLHQRLFAAGVIPYYLHLLDKVEGAAHFDVDEARALQLHCDLRAALPGYMVPRLVKEVAGENSKSLLR